MVTVFVTTQQEQKSGKVYGAKVCLYKRPQLQNSRFYCEMCQKKSPEASLFPDFLYNSVYLYRL